MPRPASSRSTADNFEGGELLGNEEHRFAPGEGGRNQVRYGLRFAGAWRTLNDQILTAKCVHEGAVLRAVGIPDKVRDILFQLGLIDRVLLGESDIRVL